MTSIAPPSIPKLYPKQHAAIYDPARYTLIEASTKCGKTAGCLIWLFVLAWNNGKPGRNYWWVAPIFPQAKIAYSRLKRMLTQSDPQGRVWKSNETELWIELASGGRIWFKGADKPDSLYGEDVYAAVIDEASRCKEESWHALRSTLTATGGPVKIIGNVRGRKNWAYQLGQKAKAGAPNTAYYKLTAYDAVEGGILSADEIEDAKRTLPDHVFKELYLAEPSDDGGNPFGIAAISACATLADLSDSPPVAFGVDLAKSVDHTVVAGLDDVGRLCRFERWQSSWRETTDRIASLIGSVPTLVDSTGVGDPIVEQLQAKPGANVEGFKFTSQSKQQLMEGLAAAVQQRTVQVPSSEHPVCGVLVSELEAFEYEYTRNGVRYSAPEGMHDDAVCGLALAVRRRTAPVSLIEVKVIDTSPARQRDDHLWQSAGRW